jgi:hypothetical protein
VDWIASTITAVLKAGWKLYLAALIASGAFLFLSDSLISQLGLDQLRHTYRMQAGVVLIVSASLLLTHLISVIWSAVLSPWHEWRFRRKIYNTLTELTEAEKDFLRPFIHQGENTQYAEIYDGIAKGLEAKQILYRSSNVGAPGGFSFPYNMQPYARKLLIDHADLLQ